MIIVAALVIVIVLISETKSIIQADEYTSCNKSTMLRDCNCGQTYYDGGIRYVVNCTDTAFKNTSMLTQLPPQVEVLIFTGNDIAQLPINVFGQLNQLSKLQTIDMSNNKIQLIRGKTYHHVPNVKKLILNHNDLEIEDDNHYSRIFSNFGNLLELHLTNAFSDRNPSRRTGFTDELYDIFTKANLTNLYKLHLEQNELEHFHEKNLFCSLNNLHDIYLSNNKIHTFDFNIDCLEKIRFIDLEFNRIESLNESHFNLLDRIANTAANLHQIFIVDFKNNEFHCDPLFKEFYNWILETKVLVRDFDQISCYKYSKGLKETVNIKDYDAEEMFDKSLEITGTNYVTFYASILLIVIIAILLMVLTAFLLTNSTFFKLRFKRNGAFYTKIESQQNRIYSL